MKKLILFIGLTISMMASAQVLNVKSQTQLNIPTGDVKVAGISHDGNYLLLTNFSNEGLRRYDLLSGKTDIISQAVGAGYNAEFTTDGAVLYREKSMQADHTMLTAIKRVRVGEKPVEVQRPTRSARQLAVAGNLQVSRPTVSIEDRQLMLTLGSITTTLSPLGNQASYIWPSVSPDGTKVLFYVCGRGTYVCGLDGKNPVFLGHDIRAPKWYNNSVVIGMNDQDNGEFTTSSEIVAVSINQPGKVQVLTNGINAMYPFTANGKIVCSGLLGETYMLTIE